MINKSVVIIVAHPDDETLWAGGNEASKARLEVPKQKKLITKVTVGYLKRTKKDGILILDFKRRDILDAYPSIVRIIDFLLAETLGKRLWEIGLFSNK